jgi:xanthine dehydrogenase accessory factor
VEGWGILQQAAELARRGEPFALATVVWRQGPSSSQQGARAIITADGELRGWIGGACAEPVVIREARDVITTGAARLLLLGSPEQFGYPPQSEQAQSEQAQSEQAQSEQAQSQRTRPPAGMTFVPIACHSEGALEVFIEPMLPVAHLVVIGDSPMASTLADLARSLGWQVDLIAGKDFSQDGAGARSLVVVATQGHDDEAVLERAVAARPAYVGLVASRRRGAEVLGYLADRGADPEALAKVRVPAGLDLGRTTHQEIAVAILAELVQLRAAGQLQARAGAGGAAGAGGQAAGAGGQAARAADPVCGMTVQIGSASRAAAYQGTTYYFCGAGCQQAFETDPAAYVERETRC